MDRTAYHGKRQASNTTRLILILYLNMILGFSIRKSAKAYEVSEKHL
jgi:hypothetical protein